MSLLLLFRQRTQKPAGIFFEYLADNAVPTYATVTTTGGITDSSGMGQPNAIPSTTAVRPTLNTGGANGHSYLTFDGVDDRLNTSNATGTMLAFGNNKPGLTLIAVMRLTTTSLGSATKTIIFFTVGGSNSTRISLNVDATGAWNMAGRRLDADATINLSGPIDADTALHLLVAVNDYVNAQQRLYLDGQLIASQAAFSAGNSSATNGNVWMWGANATPTQWVPADFYEIFGYDRALTDAEVTAVWPYAKGTYALADPPLQATVTMSATSTMTVPTSTTVSKIVATAGTPLETTATATANVVSLPPGLVDGDYTILICSASGTTPVFTLPSGWSALQASAQSTASTSHAGAVFYRKWQPGDNATPTVTSTSARVSILPVRISGADPTSFLETTPASLSPAATQATVDAPAQTPPSTGQLFVIAVGRASGSGTFPTFTAPTGMTEVGEAMSASTTASNAGSAMFAQDVPVGVSTGIRTATASTTLAGARGISFVLRSGAPPGGAATVERFATVNMTATSTFLSDADVLTEASVDMTATATLDAAAESGISGSVTMSHTSTLTTTAYRTQGASVTMALASSTLTPAAVRTLLSAAAMTAASSLTVTGVIARPAAVTMTAVTATLTPAALILRVATIAMTAATATLTSTAVRTRLASVTMTAASTLTPAAVRAQPADVVMTAAGILDVSGTRAVEADVAMTATATLDVTPTIEQLADVIMIATSTLTLGELAWRSVMVGGDFEGPLFDRLGGYWSSPQARVTDAAHSGTYSHKLTGPDPGGHTSGLTILPADATTGVVPARSWVRGSAWVLAPVGLQLVIGGRAVTSTYTYLSEDGGKNTFYGTGEWQYVQTTPWAGPTQDFIGGVQIHTTVAPTPAGTQFWVDDYVVETSPPYVSITRPAAVSMTAASSLTAAPSGNVGGSVIMSQATATLAATAVRTLLTSVQMTAAAVTLSATAVRISPASVAMTQTSTLATSAVRTLLGSITMTAQESLTVAAVRVQPASVTMTATESLTTAALRTLIAAVTMTAAETLTVTPLVTRQVTVAMTTATTTLNPTATRLRPASATMTSTGTLSLAGVIAQPGLVTMTATAELDVQALREQLAQVEMLQDSTLSLTAIRLQPAAVTMTATTLTLTITGVRAAAAAAAMTAASALTSPATGVVTTRVASVTMTQTSSFIVEITGTKAGVVTMTQTSSLTLTAVRAAVVTVAMTSTSVLSPQALRIHLATVAMTAATLALTTTAVRVQLPVVTMTSSIETLTISVTGQVSGAVAMTQTSTLTPQALRIVLPAVVMTSATRALTITAVRTQLPVVTMTSTVETLTISITGQVSGAVTMTSAIATLTSQAVRQRLGVLVMAATSSLSVATFMELASQASMVASSDLDVSAIMAQLALVQMGATGSLAATVIQTLFSLVVMTAGSTLQAIAVARGGTRVRVWDGADWVYRPMKINLGQGYVERPLRFWNGVEWS